MEGRFLGSLYGHGTGYAGAVWDTQNVSPTLNTMQGGGDGNLILSKSPDRRKLWLHLT